MMGITAIVMLSVLAFGMPALAQSEESEPVRPALLVVDVQNKYIPMMDEDGQDFAIRMINGAIWLFRESKLPIIRVYHTDPTWGPEPDTEEFEFPESIMIQEDDPKIVKNFPSAFVRTDLDALLKEKNVNTVFLCGLSATGCVLATYFGAMERDYDVFMIEGGLMSGDADQTEAVKDMVSSVGWSGLEAIVRGADR